MKFKLMPASDMQTVILFVCNEVISNYMFDKDSEAQDSMEDDVQTILATLWPGYVVNVKASLNNIEASFKIELQLIIDSYIEKVFDKTYDFEIGQ